MSNKGKKYVKLRGGEVATPQNLARAQDFLNWYAENVAVIREKLIYDYLYDDEVATDTMMNVYDSIALKGLGVQNYKYYYLRAYHTNYLATKMRKDKEARGVVDIEAPIYNKRYTANTDYLRLIDILESPDFDYETYEQTIDVLRAEITEYVRAKYDPAACSIFEIYTALQPDMSYKKLADMLGYSFQQIWPVIGAIRKDLASTFAKRKDYLLSAL